MDIPPHRPRKAGKHNIPPGGAVAAWVLVALKNPLEILKNPGRSSIETQRDGGAKKSRGPKVVWGGVGGGDDHFGTPG